MYIYIYIYIHIHAINLCKLFSFLGGGKRPSLVFREIFPVSRWNRSWSCYDNNIVSWSWAHEHLGRDWLTALSGKSRRFLCSPSQDKGHHQSPPGLSHKYIYIYFLFLLCSRNSINGWGGGIYNGDLIHRCLFRPQVLCREALHAAVQKNWLPEDGCRWDGRRWIDGWLRCLLRLVINH